MHTYIHTYRYVCIPPEAVARWIIVGSSQSSGQHDEVQGEVLGLSGCAMLRRWADDGVLNMSMCKPNNTAAILEGLYFSIPPFCF